MLTFPAFVNQIRSPVLLIRNRLLQIRTFKSDLKIKWVRPVKIPCIEPVKSGDLKPYPDIDVKSVPFYVAESEEFKSASDMVKRLFTLEFSGRKVKKEIIKRDMVKSVRRHQYDWGSFECKIARMTAEIRNHQDVYLNSIKKKNKRQQTFLKELIDKRKKYLKFLRRSDYKKFEWLLERLDLQYRPPPSHFHWITRKESLQKLTNKHCEDIKEERLKAYKDTLESQKVDFLTKKVETLKWIVEEEKACGVTPSVTQEEIDEAVQKLEELKLKTHEDVKEDAD